jgi:hypothetical protein
LNHLIWNIIFCIRPLQYTCQCMVGQWQKLGFGKLWPNVLEWVWKNFY